jgi:biopolymer transport protein ExbD
MITRPFNFSAHVTPPPSGLDVVPFINVCALLLFFGLLGSRFVLATGSAMKLELPTTAGASTDALPTSRVLTASEVDGREMLIFEGKILNLDAFERMMKDRNRAHAGEILLVRADRDVSLRLLVRINEAAAHAGFSDVLLAAEPEQAASPRGVDDGL